MGRPMIMRPLDQRLKTADRKGILRSNSPENPFWIPEENPILRVWDMTLEEYCGTVQRAVGLDLKAECGEALCGAWPELNQGDWNIGLVAMLGHGYRLTHPERKKEPLPRQNNTPADALRYVPSPTPYGVHIRWEDAALNTIGEPQSGDGLERNLMKLVLEPFHAMEERKRTSKDPDNGQKGR